MHLFEALIKDFYNNLKINLLFSMIVAPEEKKKKILNQNAH